MELSDLRIFRAIAEEGSITLAAEKLGYVQSHVTTRLRKLEDEIGVLLFYRTPKGVQITEKGKLFRQHADSILQMSDELVRVMQDNGTPSGTLRIGFVETVTCGNFMKLLSAYQAQYEQVSFHFVTGHSDELMEKVNNYELDAAFVTEDLTATSFAVDYIQTDEIVLLSGRKLDEASLLRQKWAVSPAGCPFRKRLEQWLRDEGVTMHHPLEISSLETLLSSVKEGITVTLLPKSVLTGSYEDLYVYPIPKPYQFIQVGLISRKDKYVSHAYQAFVEMVREYGL